MSAQIYSYLIDTMETLSTIGTTVIKATALSEEAPIVETIVTATTETLLVDSHQYASVLISNRRIFMVSLATTVRLTLVILASVLIFKLFKLRQTQSKYSKNQRKQDTAASLEHKSYLASLKLPPGPWGIPILGFFPFVGKELHVTLTNLSQKYGPIYQIFLGGIRVVILNDAKLIRGAFKQQVFSGRPNTRLTRILQGYGIVNSDGALWKEQRGFLHSILRKFGAKSLIHGRNGLEAKIQVSIISPNSFFLFFQHTSFTSKLSNVLPY